MLERLQKVLAAAGVASRRDAEGLISSGRVRVDGRLITELGTKVDPEHAAIEVDGRPIAARPPALYVALHKPPGFDTTRADPHAPHTVMELVLPGLEAKFGRGHPSIEGLHPVGRLDRDSEGLLLLTNDGAFTHALTHPRHGVTKTYVVELDAPPSRAQLQQLRDGIEIDGLPTRPAGVRLLSGAAGRGCRLQVELREGRKRQVRRMLAAVGHPVRRLIRTAIGPVSLGALKPGQHRLLSPAEVHALLEEAARGELPADAPVPPRAASPRAPQQASTERRPPARNARTRPEPSATGSPRPGPAPRQTRRPGTTPRKRLP